VRRVGDIALLVVQWLLTLWGIALVVLSLLEYSGHSQLQQGLTVSGFESSLNAPPTHQLQLQATLGLVALGLSGALFYLRRLYLSR
jgi:hypothetical protein